MELLRFYCDPLNKPVAELAGPEVHHAASVRRLKAGDKVELFDGKGSVATAAIISATSRKVTLKIDELKIIPKPACAQIILAVSVAKGERFDWLIAKATELGADRICPVIFERTVKQPKNPKIVDRWLNIAISAAKQCRRIFLPQIDSPAPLPKVIELLKADHPKACLLLGSLDQDSKPLIAQSFGDHDCIAVVGPEGGLTEKEQIFLKNQGAQHVRISITVLRVETAALAFTAVLSAQRDAGQCPRNTTS